MATSLNRRKVPLPPRRRGCIGRLLGQARKTCALLLLVVVLLVFFVGTGARKPPLERPLTALTTQLPLPPSTEAPTPAPTPAPPPQPPPPTVWLRGTNGRLAPSSECTPVPSWGYWRARCGAKRGVTNASTPRCGAGTPGRSVVLQLATDVTVTRVLCSGAACGSRHPPFARVQTDTSGSAFAWRVDVGACSRSPGSAAEVPAAVEGAPASDVYLDVEVVEDEAARAAETCFLSVGDWGKEGLRETSVANAMNKIAALNPAVRFIVSTGDNFYMAGIYSLDDPQIQTTFEQPFNQPLMKQMMWLISAGNHDREDYGLQAQFDFSVTSNHPKRSERWYFPQGTYSVEMPVNAHRSMRLVVMDTFGENPERMVKFMGAELSDALNGTKRVPPPLEAIRRRRVDEGDALGVPVNDRWQGGAEDWRIVVNHSPLYSGALHGRETSEVRRARALIKPTLDRVKAHMYISGHDHVLEVHRDDKLTDYFVSGGGGGSGISHSEWTPTTKYFDPRGLLGFMQHCFKGDLATTTVYGVEDTKPLFVHATPLEQHPPSPPPRGRVVHQRRSR